MEKCRLMVFDIETIATENKSLLAEIAQEAIEKRPAQNTLKDLKTLWDTVEAREARAVEAVSKTSCDPLLAEPIVCCFRADGAGYSMPMFLERKNGMKTLRNMWQDMTGPETIWIGHNIKGFDLPILLNTWRREGVAPPDHFPRFRNGRWVGRIFDTMAMCPTKTPFERLDTICKAMGLGGAKTFKDKEGEAVSGARVAELYAARQWDTISEYCAADVEIQERLFMTMTFDDSWGSFDEEGDLQEMINEIRANETTTDTQKKLHIYSLLETAGRI